MKPFISAAVLGPAVLALVTAGFLRTRVAAQAKPESAQHPAVTIEQVKYSSKEPGPGRLQLVEMQADLSGSYVSLARFINALERNEMLFIINSVTLGSEQAGHIKLQMKLETYLKAGA